MCGHCFGLGVPIGLPEGNVTVWGKCWFVCVGDCTGEWKWHGPSHQLSVLVTNAVATARRSRGVCGVLVPMASFLCWCTCKNGHVINVVLRVQ